MADTPVSFTPCPCGQKCGEVWAKCDRCGDGDYILIRERSAFRDAHKHCRPRGR